MLHHTIFISMLLVITLYMDELIMSAPALFLSVIGDVSSDALVNTMV